MKKSIGFIVLLFAFISHVHAEPRVHGYFSVGGFAEENGIYSGGEMSIMGHVGKHFALKGSGVLFVGADSSQNIEFFEGGSVTTYVHLDQKTINPYFGVGLFSGETFNCSEREKRYDNCREKYVLALYPEAGVALNVDRLHLFFYVRHYYDTNNDNDENSYGLNVGFKL